MKPYNADVLQEAVSAVKNKFLTYQEAEEIHGVPRSVIYNRIAGRQNSLERIGQGRTPVLGEEVEKKIANLLMERARMFDPCHKTELCQHVGEYVKLKKLKTPFKDGIPGDKWYGSFIKRFPRLSYKKPEHLQKVRQTARKPEIVFDFYRRVNVLIKKKKLRNKPQFIFNTDESGFMSDPNKVKGIGIKGEALLRVSGGSGRESTTVLACVSADGQKLPPLVVFKACAVQDNWTANENEGYPGTLYTTSANGWMEEAVFFNWFRKGTSILPTCFHNKIQESSVFALLIFY